ncbi:fibrinogen-binding adhesin SdrG C-terminal domain-containing protein, partial [Staphylococcus aureus]|uniref:fibrinogen-binding adhesin SdrG C-terminal domain-containing protein n=1 Tax=Staphylococcus aureus TaxID=1280 RepID=UPI001642D413
GNLIPNTNTNALIDAKNTHIKLYTLHNANHLSQTYYLNPTHFQHLTNQLTISFPNPNQYKLQFPTHHHQITTPYIVLVNAHIHSPTTPHLALPS